MDDQGCPRCKTTKYRNPSLILMVNICGHSLCDNCVDLLFMRGTGACPQCNTPLRRNNFRVQQFEDSYVEKEIDIRRKILRDFNKKEEDFDTLREYNDYLEMVENIIFNLTNSIDVESTKKMVEQYKKENKDQISQGRPKISKDEEYLEMLIEEERHISDTRYKETKEEEIQEKQQKKKNKEALIDELMFSQSSASTIVDRHKAELERQAESKAIAAAKKPVTQFSTGISFFNSQSSMGNVPPPKREEAPLYCHEPVEFDIMGPTLPKEEELETLGYLSNIRKASSPDLAGGYKSRYACGRALQDALSGLFFMNPPTQRSSTPSSMQTDNG